MPAKYYIYRNLHTKSFSVKYRGKVIAHPYNFIATNVQFKVNETGRQKVLATKRKSVHAYLVCDSYEELPTLSYKPSTEIYYNPYKTSVFLFAGVPIKEYPTAKGIEGKYIYLT